jgi:hypothetical protein
MRQTKIAQSTDSELVAEFAAFAKERGAAVLDLDAGRANILFDRMRGIDRELRTRGGDARLALAPLLDDSDRFVRFYAAVYLLSLLPDKSRAVMEWNAKYGGGSIAADARRFLRGLDEGTYKPT